MKKAVLFIVLFFGLNAIGAESKTEKPSFYSLYAWNSEFPAFANEVEKAGFKWMRLGGPVFEEKEDKGLVEAVKKGIKVIPVLGDKNADVTKLPAFREYMKKYLARYGENGTLWKENPSVKQIPFEYIEIWNEPNLEYLTQTGGKKKDECYAEFLKIAYEEIKKFDPKIKVIGLNTSGGAWNAATFIMPNGENQKGIMGFFRFIKGVHSYGGGKYYDILGIHPYTGKKAPEKVDLVKTLEAIREECKTNAGEEKPIWITEVGFSLPVKQASEAMVKTEDDQANFLIRYMGLAAANGIGQFQIMYISDIGDFKAGLFDRKKTWRKQAYAVKNMMKVLPEPVLVKKLAEGADGIFAYVFKGTGDKETIMAWNTGKEAVEHEFEMKGSELTLVSRDGEKKALKASGGKVKVALTQSPVYIY